MDSLLYSDITHTYFHQTSKLWDSIHRIVGLEEITWVIKPVPSNCWRTYNKGLSRKSLTSTSPTRCSLITPLYTPKHGIFGRKKKTEPYKENSTMFHRKDSGETRAAIKPCLLLLLQLWQGMLSISNKPSCFWILARRASHQQGQILR